jgi:ABC-2 type transport system ATP-binding protein
MIEVNQLTKRYGQQEVLSVDHLHVAPGERLGLVGNNGAGKTTLFRLLLDLLRPTTGEVRSQGQRVYQSDHWKAYTGAYLDEGFLLDYLTPEEYFSFVGQLHELSAAELADRLRPLEGLFNQEILNGNKYIRDLSQGNRKKVGVAAALLTHPAVAILDEPFSNLDPTTQIRLKDLLRTTAEERQTTLLISSHDLSHVTEVCNRIVVLHQGRVIRDLRTDKTTLPELEAFFAEGHG